MASLAKWVAEFVLRESFFYIDCFGTVDDFRERLLTDVAERNLSAMVKATGDNATIVQNGNVRIERAASACDDFLAYPLVFALRARLLGSVIQISVLICATLASFVYTRPFKSCVFVQINSPCDVETFVAAAKVAWRDFDIESFADAA